jgi:hypothetical protein
VLHGSKQTIAEAHQLGKFHVLHFLSQVERFTHTFFCDSKKGGLGLLIHSLGFLVGRAVFCRQTFHGRGARGCFPKIFISSNPFPAALIKLRDGNGSANALQVQAVDALGGFINLGFQIRIPRI